MQMQIYGARRKKHTKLKIVTFAVFFSFAVMAMLFFFNRQNEPRNFVALGDSVTSGYGLYSAYDSYSSLLFKLLENAGFVDEYLNMGINGLTTTMLLEQLYGLSSEEKDFIRNARIITINIGGNNILSPFLNYLSEFQVVSGAETMVSGAGELLQGAWGVVFGIISNIDSFITGSDGAVSFGDIVSNTGEIVSGAGNIIVGTGEIISGTPRAFSTFSGSFSPELEYELSKGVESFSNEFSEIIYWLQRNAPMATIIVNTLYNPIPQDVLNLSLEISNISNVLINSLNYIIYAESTNRGFLVTEMHHQFSNQLDMMQFNLNPNKGELSLDIIHPNVEGHRLIAYMAFSTFKEYVSDN